LAYRRNAPELRDTCGMIGIGQFGEAAGVPAPRPGAYIPSEERRHRLMDLENTKRDWEAKYLAPSDLSFCKVAFPNFLVGDNFPQVFRAFCDLNTMHSERYERIQQILIDALDTCQRVELVGAGENQTRLTIVLPHLEDPRRETNFLNCGGDLNIPHGELFTTPVLSGTNGVLHVGEIYLKGIYFKDLMLRFADGMVTEYGCGGYGDAAAGQAYVKEHLLQGNESLPMGEFAIGSNTLAYAIARDLKLVSRMPILLAEKMGPHIAVGDPCFARGEDAPVYNLYDHKEMTARENQRTAQRGTGQAVYTNVHTDITLAFDELAALDGILADGSRVPILKDGRFVLAGTEPLNEPLEGAVQK
ncbi:MAG: aminopeptidase, partial [Pseudoflavonifractor sp.]